MEKDTSEDIQSDVLLKEATDILNQRDLYIYNDDVNTVEYIEMALVKYLKHTKEQAAQCTLIAHYKGSCSVKRGDPSILKPYRNTLNHLNIKADIK